MREPVALPPARGCQAHPPFEAPGAWSRRAPAALAALVAVAGRRRPKAPPPPIKEQRETMENTENSI